MADGFTSVIAHIVTPHSLPVYRIDLPDAFIVQLRLSLAEARMRASTRRVYLTDEEFEIVHSLVAEPADVDLVLDVGGLSLSEQLDAIRAAWAEE